MRAEPFLRWLATHYDTARAESIASTVRFKGGWEGWLQVEIARKFLDVNGAQVCAREVPYPSGQNGQYVTPDGGLTNDLRFAARADFYLRRKGSSVDETYLELKCTNQYADDPVDDAWKRFHKDVAKIINVQNTNKSLNCIALLAYWGTVDFVTENDVVYLAGVPVKDYWGITRRTYIWRTSEYFAPDEKTDAILSLPDAYELLRGEEQDESLIIVALSPIAV
jgi:hypothetical protein